MLNQHMAIESDDPLTIEQVTAAMVARLVGCACLGGCGGVPPATYRARFRTTGAGRTS
jgi:hypothetical protein